MGHALPVVVLLGASTLWGLAWLPLKGIHGLGINGVALTFGTYLILSLLFTPAIMRQRRLINRGNLRTLLLIALFGGGANLAFAVALIYGEVVRVMMLFFLLPVWAVLGGRFFLKERVDMARWIGVGLALSGAVLILGGLNALGGMPSWVDLLALAAGLLLALNNLVFRAARNEPMVIKIGAMFYGCVAISGLLLLSGVAPWPQAAGLTAWGAVALYAVAWLLLANLGAQYGVTHLEAGRAAIIMIIELVVSVVSATMIGHETMNGWEMFGGGLILIAALIEALREGHGPESPSTI